MSFLIFCYNIFMFGKRLKELRTYQNLTQKQLASILQCNQSMITRWEKEECEPTESIIKRASIFFNVTADYLLGLEDEDGHKEPVDYDFEYSHADTKLIHREKNK